MKRQFLLSLIMLLFLPQDSFAFENGDFQYWNKNSVSVTVVKDLKLSAFEEFRFGDNAGNFYDHRTDLGIIYSGLADWLDVAAHHTFIFTEDESDWDYEHRTYIDATLKLPIWKLKFNDRSRVDFRNREDRGKSVRYRNMVKFAIPLEVGKIVLEPYVAEEVYFNFSDDGFSKNRVYSGIYSKLFKNIGLDLYYIWEIYENAEESWEGIHVLGSNLKISF